MKKLKIYLDTSVISHLDAHDTPERMRETQEFWDVLRENQRYDVCTSSVMNLELDRCPEPKKTILLRHLADISHVSIAETSEIRELADEYARQGVLSRKHFNDLRHIAYAVVAGCSIIVSWNFKHFVNVQTFDRVNAVNLINGYPLVKIVPPTMLISKGDNDDKL